MIEVVEDVRVLATFKNWGQKKNRAPNKQGDPAPSIMLVSIGIDAIEGNFGCYVWDDDRKWVWCWGKISSRRAYLNHGPLLQDCREKNRAPLETWTQPIDITSIIVTATEYEPIPPVSLQDQIRLNEENFVEISDLKQDRDAQIDYIYVMYSPRCRLTKFGHGRDVEKCRLRHIRDAKDKDIGILGRWVLDPRIKGTDVEAYFKNRYAEHITIGKLEWVGSQINPNSVYEDVRRYIVDEHRGHEERTMI